MTPGLDASFLAAIMLLVAIIGGYIAKFIRIPRIVAYIVGGVILRLVIGRTETPERLGELVASLGFVNEFALGLILFMMGSIFEASRLKETRGVLRNFSPWEIGYTALWTTIGCTVAAWTIPAMTWRHSLTTGLLLGTVSIATAPAATWFVLREYSAKGPTSAGILMMTGINNLISIISFQMALVLCVGLGLMQGAALGHGAWWSELLFVSFGSFALGGVLGVMLGLFHSRLPLREMILLFFATLFLLAAGDTWMRAVTGVTFNPMVTTLVMGAVFVNIARDPGFFEQTLETVSMPLFALFFVLAGYSLHLEELFHLGFLGVVYIAARSAGKYYGVRRAVRELGDKTKIAENAGLGLLCQAGVAVFLGSSLVQYWDDPMAVKINAMILASVAVYELVGPLLVKYTAVEAGEVKLVTLIRPGFLKPTWISPAPGFRNLLREYNASHPKAELGKDITVKHLMRTNIHFLQASDTFDDILKFIEQSRFNDFPVVDLEGNYLGVVHFRKIRDQIYSPATKRLVSAGSLAERGTPPVTPETPLEVLFDLFHAHNLGEIAVVNNLTTKHLIGIVEQRDLLRFMSREE